MTVSGARAQANARRDALAPLIVQEYVEAHAAATAAGDSAATSTPETGVPHIKITRDGGPAHKKRDLNTRDGGPAHKKRDLNTRDGGRTRDP